MVPAMDRVRMPVALRSGLTLGLGLALSLVELGCARLSWHKQTPEPPMLGRMGETTDIYAMSRRPGGPDALPVTIPAGTVGGIAPVPGGDPPKAGLEEIKANPTQSPPESPEPSLSPSAGGVALQRPTPIEGRANPRPANGVPNAGLVLASAERPSRDATGPTARAAEVVAEARAVLDSMSNYEVSLHRQERVNGSLLPEEDVILAIRRQPRAVRLTWPSGTNEGREVLYRSDEPGAPMHVKMANPALPRLSLSPDSPMVMRNSRHPVTEAGLDSIVEGLEVALKDSTPANVIHAGLEVAEGLEQPQDCLVRTTSTGENWRIFFDPKTHLPSLVLATDAGGQLLERYHFREVRPNVPELASSEAFDVNARWGPSRGLLGRFARAATWAEGCRRRHDNCHSGQSDDGAKMKRARNRRPILLRTGSLKPLPIA